MTGFDVPLLWFQNRADAVAERLYGRPTPRSPMDYQRRRKELLLALLDDYTDRVDQAAEEMGRFFDHLRQVGVRGFVAENANDVDYQVKRKDRSGEVRWTSSRCRSGTPGGGRGQVLASS